MLRYFRIKLFPNITTLFYRSQLHVPLHVRNRGWGSRYRGLGILTPPQTFVFEIIRISVMCPRNAQIFLNQLFPNISTLFKSVTVTCSIVCQEYSVGVNIPWPGYLDLRPVWQFWNKKCSYMSKKNSDNFRRYLYWIVFSITTLFYQSQ